jgi:hypothetical protein
MRHPIDTSVEARKRQLDAYRAMTPDARLRLADQMSAEIRSLARSGIRARNATDVSEAALDAELARILLGPELAAVVARARRTVGSR